MRFDLTVPPYSGSSPQELGQRLRNGVAIVSIHYPDNPCADPGCKCIVHKLGLAQADEYARLREMRREARERRHSA